MKKFLLGLSCIYILTSCTIGSKTSEIISSSAPVNTQYKTDLDTASNKIKDTQEFADCMAPSVNMCINTVGMQLAQKAKSTEFCTELSDPEQQEGCRFAVIMADASEKNDPTACSTLSGTYQVQCAESIYRSQAITKKDISLCNKLETNTNKNNTGENDITSEKKNECIMSVLISDPKTTEEDCDKIHEKSFQDMCKSTIQNNKTHIR